MPGDLALLLGRRAARGPGTTGVAAAGRPGAAGRRGAQAPGYFAPVADTPGFGEALFRLVRELRGAGYDLSDLGPLLDGATDAPEKAGSLAGILSEFEQRRVRLLRPGRCAAGRRRRLASTGSRCWSGGCSTCRRRSSGCCAGSPSGCLSTCISPMLPAAADAPLAELRARLLAGGAAERHVAESREEDTALERVRRSMFTAPAKPAIAEDGTLRLVSAPDPSREVRAAARACLQWAREGVPFWDMAVAYRHGEAYLPLAEAVFVEAGIPVYLHEGSPLAERPIGRQTLGLLALFDGDLSRQAVMDFLTDAKFPEALHDEYGGIPASRWDSLSREAGIVKGAEQWQRRLGAVQRGGRRRRAARLGRASVPRTPAGSRGSSPTWTNACGSGRRGPAGPSISTTCRACWCATSRAPTR